MQDRIFHLISAVQEPTHKVAEDGWPADLLLLKLLIGILEVLAEDFPLCGRDRHAIGARHDDGGQRARSKRLPRQWQANPGLHHQPKHNHAVQRALCGRLMI
jgi:hypothetical protein